MDDLTRFLKLLLDAERLAVIGAIATAARTVDEVAEHAAVDRRTVLETLAVVTEAGVARELHGRYQLERAALVDVAQRMPHPAPPAGAVFHGMTDAEGEILARFFRGEKLTEIPSARAKRLVVLERIALEFEPGRRYGESEVNEVVGRFHEDHASLRRHLVDEDLLDREPVEVSDGTTEVEYWRTGGRVLTRETAAADRTATNPTDREDDR